MVILLPVFLQQALVGEATREEKIISKVSMSKDNISTELSGYLQKLEVMSSQLGPSDLVDLSKF